MTEKKDRIITVDGIGYSLDTGKAVGPAQAKSQPAESAPSSDKSSNTLDLRHFAPTPMANPSANTKSMSAKKPTSPDKTAQDKPSVKSSDGLSGQERRGQVEKKKPQDRLANHQSKYIRNSSTTSQKGWTRLFKTSFRPAIHSACRSICRPVDTAKYYD